MNPWLALASKAVSEGDQGVERRATRQTFEELGARLASKGFLPRTDWWREQLGRFYDSEVKRFAARVGRGGIKSTTMVDVGINETALGKWNVPIGEVHYFAFVSETKPEATQRLGQIEARLTALEIHYVRAGDAITIPSLRTGFRVFACSIGSVSGFRCIGFCADELSKWTAGDKSANPAQEVVASIRAMTVTHPGAREFFVSSPWSRTDLHYSVIEDGDTAAQVVAIAPSWVANPSITEEQTHALEKDEPTWLREYAAIPSDSIRDNWFGLAIDQAIAFDVPPEHWGIRYVIAIDAAFQGDLFGWAVVASHRDKDTGRRTTWTHASGAWEPAAFDHRPSQAAAKVKAELCDKYKTTTVYGDQHEAASFTELARQAGFRLEIVPWLGSSAKESKTERFRAVRTAMLEGAFRIPNDASLHAEMRRFAGLYSNGQERVEYARNSDVPGHGDRVSALVLAGSIALARAANDIKEEPPQPGSAEWAAQEQQRMRAEAIAEMKKRHKKQSLRKAMGM